MHELALASSLFKIMETTAAQNGGGRIEAATLRLGAMTHIEPETLSFAFDVVTRGTCAEGCQLRFERVPLTVTCPSCRFAGEIAPDAGACPQCGGVGLTVTGGREIELDSIELEELPHA
jgi:hydrogenase nickel incorporation protein HypA/HybF